MGYETRFELTYDAQGQSRPQCEHTIPAKSKFCPECGAQVRQVPLSELIDAAIQDDDNLRHATTEACKWYEWEADMKALSLKFPSVCFKLHGEGEEPGDIWDAYFLKGKSQVKKAKIIIDECDPKAWK